MTTNLSPRQVQILRAIAGGDSTKQIAGNLGISKFTVAVHRTRIVSRLKCRNMFEAVSKFAAIYTV